jgi:hypothetical protein
MNSLACIDGSFSRFLTCHVNSSKDVNDINDSPNNSNRKIPA